MPDPRMAQPQGQPQGQPDPMQQVQAEIQQMPRPELEQLAMQLVMELQNASGGGQPPQGGGQPPQGGAPQGGGMR